MLTFVIANAVLHVVVGQMRSKVAIIIRNVLRMDVPEIIGDILHTPEVEIVINSLHELIDDIIGESMSV